MGKKSRKKHQQDKSDLRKLQYSGQALFAEDNKHQVRDGVRRSLRHQYSRRDLQKED